MKTSTELRARPEALQLYELSLSFLSSAEFLCESMIEDDFPADFGRGLVVMNAIHHGIELFYKGALCSANGWYPKSHDLNELRRSYEEAIQEPHLHFSIPFGYVDPDNPELLPEEGEKYFRTLHERFRYPTDRQGKVWPELEGIELQSLLEEVTNVKMKVIQAWADITAQRRDR